MADRVTQKGKATSDPGGIRTGGQLSTMKGPLYREQDHYPKKREGSNPNPGKRTVTG